MDQRDIVYDMETADVDDYFALLFLTSHPAVRLRAVTLTPGSRAQVGLVRRVLALTGHADTLVGSRDPEHRADCVEPFHYALLDGVTPRPPDGHAHALLADVLTRWPATTVVTGAPLDNLHLLLQHHPTVRIARWVAQGGFAGAKLVPPEARLAEFGARRTYRSFNFDGDPAGTRLLLTSARVGQRDLVAKNVTHRVVYDQALHARVAAVKHATPGLRLIYQGMDRYLQRRHPRKLFHDPLAACVAVDRAICVFREVTIYRDAQGGWGASACPGTGTWITVAVEHDRFLRTFLQYQ